MARNVRRQSRAKRRPKNRYARSRKFLAHPQQAASSRVSTQGRLGRGLEDFKKAQYLCVAFDRSEQPASAAPAKATVASSGLIKACAGGAVRRQRFPAVALGRCGVAKADIHSIADWIGRWLPGGRTRQHALDAAKERPSFTHRSSILPSLRSATRCATLAIATASRAGANPTV